MGKDSIERVAFFDQVKKHFRYLIDDYGFSVVYERYDEKVFGNCIVVFQSKDCRIRVVLDRGDIFVQIGPLSAPAVWSPASSHLWFDLGTIIAFLTQEAKADRAEWFYIPPDEPLDHDARIDWQLNKLADTLQSYGKQILSLFTEGIWV